MNAVISGQAGVALLVDGQELSSIHVDRPDEVVRRRPRDIPYLLGDAKDLQFLEAVQVPEVGHRLELATNQMDAFHLALILLDADLSWDTRRTAAEELEEELETEEVAEFVERVLYAHPLPAGGDLPGARSSCTGRTDRVRRFLQSLGRLQTTISEVHLAWEQIPTSAFQSEQDRRFATSVAVREGFFRELVLNRADRGSLDVFSAGCLHNDRFNEVPSHIEILRAWIGVLRAAESAPDHQEQLFESQALFVAEEREPDGQGEVGEDPTPAKE